MRFRNPILEGEGNLKFGSMEADERYFGSIIGAERLRMAIHVCEWRLVTVEKLNRDGVDFCEVSQEWESHDSCCL